MFGTVNGALGFGLGAAAAFDQLINDKFFARSFDAAHVSGWLAFAAYLVLPNFFALCYLAIKDESAPLARSAEPPALCDLPKDVSGFVGRRELVKDLTRRIRTRRAKVIGLIGEGGWGKTSLAAKVAREVRRHIGEPLWIECKPETTFDVTASRLVRVLDPKVSIDALPRMSQGEQIAAICSSLKDRSRLVVLNNVQELFQETPGGPAGVFREGAFQDLLDAFLSTDHRSTVIVTSREDLATGGVGERLYCRPHLDRLEAEAARRLLRASGIKKGTEEELAEIIERVNANPFWLEQAAAIAREEGGSAGSVLARRDLLTPDGQRLIQEQLSRIDGTPALVAFRAIALLRQPATLSALQFALTDEEQPIDEDAASDALSTLRRRSLAQHDTIDKKLTTVHPEIRAYLRRHERQGRWDQPPAKELHRRAARYWLSLDMPSRMPAIDAEDVRPIIEAHHHLLEASEWIEASEVSTMNLDFGIGPTEDVTEFLSRRGYPMLRVQMEEANSAGANRAKTQEHGRRSRTTLGTPTRACRRGTATRTCAGRSQHTNWRLRFERARPVPPSGRRYRTTSVPPTKTCRRGMSTRTCGGRSQHTNWRLRFERARPIRPSGRRPRTTSAPYTQIC